MKTKAFNIHIEYENINEDVICDNIDEVCHFLGITKSQYIGLKNGRTKFKRDYNKHLNHVKVSKIKLETPTRIKRKIIEINDIIKKITDLTEEQKKIISVDTQAS